METKKLVKIIRTNGPIMEDSCNPSTSESNAVYQSLSASPKVESMKENEEIEKDELNFDNGKPRTNLTKNKIEQKLTGNEVKTTRDAWDLLAEYQKESKKEKEERNLASQSNLEEPDSAILTNNVIKNAKDLLDEFRTKSKDTPTISDTADYKMKLIEESDSTLLPSRFEIINGKQGKNGRYSRICLICDTTFGFLTDVETEEGNTPDLVLFHQLKLHHIVNLVKEYVERQGVKNGDHILVVPMLRYADGLYYKNIPQCFSKKHAPMKQVAYHHHQQHLAHFEVVSSKVQKYAEENQIIIDFCYSSIVPYNPVKIQKVLVTKHMKEEHHKIKNTTQLFGLCRRDAFRYVKHCKGLNYILRTNGLTRVGKLPPWGFFVWTNKIINDGSMSLESLPVKNDGCSFIFSSIVDIKKKVSKLISNYSTMADGRSEPNIIKAVTLLGDQAIKKLVDSWPDSKLEISYETCAMNADPVKLAETLKAKYKDTKTHFILYVSPKKFLEIKNLQQCTDHKPMKYPKCKENESLIALILKELESIRSEITQQLPGCSVSFPSVHEVNFNSFLLGLCSSHFKVTKHNCRDLFSDTFFMEQSKIFTKSINNFNEKNLLRNEKANVPTFDIYNVLLKEKNCLGDGLVLSEKSFTHLVTDFEATIEKFNATQMETATISRLPVHKRLGAKDETGTIGNVISESLTGRLGERMSEPSEENGLFESDDDDLFLSEQEYEDEDFDPTGTVNRSEDLYKQERYYEKQTFKITRHYDPQHHSNGRLNGESYSQSHKWDSFSRGRRQFSHQYAKSFERNMNYNHRNHCDESREIFRLQSPSPFTGHRRSSSPQLQRSLSPISDRRNSPSPVSHRPRSPPMSRIRSPPMSRLQRRPLPMSHIRSGPSPMTRLQRSPSPNSRRSSLLKRTARGYPYDSANNSSGSFMSEQTSSRSPRMSYRRREPSGETRTFNTSRTNVSLVKRGERRMYERRDFDGSYPESMQEDNRTSRIEFRSRSPAQEKRARSSSYPDFGDYDYHYVPAKDLERHHESLSSRSSFERAPPVIETKKNKRYRDASQKKGKNRKKKNSSDLSTSRENQAMATLREIHEKECERYRSNPAIHPSYNKEKTLYIQRMSQMAFNEGRDPHQMDFAKGFKKYWAQRQEALFDESWCEKKSSCLNVIERKQNGKKKRRIEESYDDDFYLRNKSSYTPPLPASEESINMSVVDMKSSAGKRRHLSGRSVNEDMKSVRSNSSQSFIPEPDFLYIKEEPYIDKMDKGATLTPPQKVKPSKLVNSLDIVETLTVLSQMPDKFGDLAIPLSEMFRTAVQFRKSGRDPIEMFERQEFEVLRLAMKTLAHMKMQSLSFIQKAIVDEGCKRIEKLLSYLHEHLDPYFSLDIYQVATEVDTFSPSEGIAHIKQMAISKGFFYIKESEVFKIYVAAKKNQR